MKKIKNLVLLAVLLMSTFSVNAARYTFDSSNPGSPSLRHEIKEYIDSGIDHISKKGTVTLNFLVNSKNELVVVSIDDNRLGESLRSLLNYKRIDAEDYEVNKLYTMNITVEK